MIDPESAEPRVGEALPSLGRNSIALFAGEASKVILGFITAVVTARSLGPEGKGTLSTLLFIGVLLSYACTMGLGDAATVLVARGRYTLQQAASASILPIAAACAVGIACLWIIVPIADWVRIVPAVAVASALIPLATYARMLTALINTKERIAFTSLVSTLSAAVTAVLLVVLLIGLDMELFGAMVAAVAGGLTGVLILIRFLKSIGISVRPAKVQGYVQEAVRFGWLVEASYLLVAMSQRLDLLIVYALLGEAPAGRYSIALTLSQLAGYGPFALIMASFPRLAHLGEERFLPLVTQLFRISLIAGLLAAMILAAALPLFVEPLFGPAFAGAVTPALLLLAAAILGSQQWLLARAAVSIGRNKLYPVSFGVSVTLLTVLDYLLIPRFGLPGAAIAAICSTAIGLTICLAWFRRSFGVRLRDLQPQVKDLAVLIRVLGTLRPTPVERE